MANGSGGPEFQMAGLPTASVMQRVAAVPVAAPENQPWLRRNMVPLIVALALLMEQMDSTILSTALPVIARDIHAPVLSLKLALATYLISLAAFVPASGWLADRFGAKRVYIAAMLVFLAGSALCAVQSHLVGLVLARGLQGAGGAMMVPVGRLIVLRSVARKDLVQALAYVVMPALVGPAVGPVVGATVTTALGWRWIFLINLPIGVIAILLALRYLSNVGAPVRERFDVPGFLLLALGLGASMFGLSALDGDVLPAPIAIGLLGAGPALLCAYFLRSGRREDALLDARLLGVRTFRIGVLGNLQFRLSGGAAAFLLPLLFQVGFGLSIIVSGLLSALYALGVLAMRGFGSRILDRFGFRPVLILGTVASCACTAGFGFVHHLHYAVLIPLLIVAGFLQAVVFTAASGLAFADIPEARMSRATSFSAVAQQLSLTIGIAIPAFVLQFAGGLSPGGAPSLASFGPAFWIAAACAMTSLGSYLQLRPGDGAALRHRERALRHHWP